MLSNSSTAPRLTRAINAGTQILPRQTCSRRCIVCAVGARHRHRRRPRHAGSDWFDHAVASRLQHARCRRTAPRMLTSIVRLSTTINARRCRRLVDYRGCWQFLRVLLANGTAKAGVFAGQLTAPPTPVAVKRPAPAYQGVASRRRCASCVANGTASWLRSASQERHRRDAGGRAA